jgi:hypothetical protein
MQKKVILRNRGERSREIAAVGKPSEQVQGLAVKKEKGIRESDHLLPGKQCRQESRPDQVVKDATGPEQGLCCQGRRPRTERLKARLRRR